MLDLGGAPSALNSQQPIRTQQASKNSQVQAVVFQFNLQTTANEQADELMNNHRNDSSLRLGQVQPDSSKVQQVANLLNVTLGGTESTKSRRREDDDDLSLLTGQQNKPKVDTFSDDIRTKYMSKLAKKKQALSGIDLAKQEADGDTDASFHLQARQQLAQQATTSSSKWMALSGTGALLSYLSHRSIQICLYDWTSRNGNDDERRDEMEAFTKQLPQVVFDSILSIPPSFGHDAATCSKWLVHEAMKEFECQDPANVLLVTNEDAILRAAKDVQMLTCRITPPNTRRGNVSAHYTVPTLSDVQRVVNELNGISFNAVLNR